MPTVGQVTYTFKFDGRTAYNVVDRAARETMDDLAKDIGPYLHSYLHRWTGEMADMAFAEVHKVPDGYELEAGSDSDHTFWHEVRYHPQLRATLDRFAPQIGPRLQAKLGTGT